MSSRQAAVARLRRAGCVFAEREEVLLREHSADDPDRLEQALRARERGEPLEHIVGWAALVGLRFAVAPGVFVPRPRSALLVSRARRALPRAPVVADLACGCGALGLAVLRAVAGARLYAADLDARAVACARANVATYGSRLVAAEVVEADLAAPPPPHWAGQVDVLVANVPYVPSGELGFLPAEARDHEPRTALDGGPDGLELARRLVRAAPAWLAPGGRVFIECSSGQGPLLAGAFAGAGASVRMFAAQSLGGVVVSGRFGTRAPGRGRAQLSARPRPLPG